MGGGGGGGGGGGAGGGRPQPEGCPAVRPPPPITLNDEQVYDVTQAYYASAERAQRVARNHSHLQSLFSQVLKAIAPNPQVGGGPACCWAQVWPGHTRLRSATCCGLALAMPNARVSRTSLLWVTASPGVQPGPGPSTHPC